MSTQNTQNDSQEIDLSAITQKFNQGIESFLSWIFRGFLFFKRNIIIIAILLILGAVLGFYLDENEKTYDSKIVVMPNFSATDYLYSKVNLINSKIKEKDTLFLKEKVGIKMPSKLKLIEVKPITDIYRFIADKEENFQLIKLMAEDGEIKKIIEDNITSKNYIYHIITLTTKEKIVDNETVQPLMTYLNNSDYYQKIQKIILNNNKIKIAQNDTIIAQIDKFLNGIGNNVGAAQKNDKLIYYNENTQLNDVIKTKEDIIDQQGYRRLELLNFESIIKEVSQTLNIKNTAALNGKLKLIMPIVFIIIFLFLGLIRSFYRRQMSKLNNQIV